MLIEPEARRQRELLGVEFDLITTAELLGRLDRVTAQSEYSYIVTPNVDHLVRLEALEVTGEEIRRAYRQASACVCDSRVLARLAWLLGVRLTVVPGSDLTAKIFKTLIRSGDRIAIIGGDGAMVEVLRRSYPSVDFVQHVPPMGLRDNKAAMIDAARFAAASGARFIFLAIGSPQQELLAQLIADMPDASGCALCIGAAVEFVSGKQKRAPVLVQKLSLEWSYRLLMEPKRLWRRYLVVGPRIVPALLRWRLRLGSPSS